MCLRSLEWNVWLLGQSDSTHRLRAQLLRLHERGAHADNLLDGHTSCLCRDDATIMSTTEDPGGFPQSGAPAAEGSHNVKDFCVLASGNSGGIMSRSTVVLASRKLVPLWDRESVVPTIYSPTVKREERSR